METNLDEIAEREIPITKKDCFRRKMAKKMLRDLMKHRMIENMKKYDNGFVVRLREEEITI